MNVKTVAKASRNIKSCIVPYHAIDFNNTFPIDKGYNYYHIRTEVPGSLAQTPQPPNSDNNSRPDKTTFFKAKILKFISTFLFYCVFYDNGKLIF